jgi:hypothetical protein
LHQNPLRILKVHYHDTKRKRKDEVLIYITIVLKQLKKNQIPTKKKTSYALLACRVFFGG